MSNQHAETISTIFCEVLEAQARMFVDEVEMTELSPTGEEYVVAQIEYGGAGSGALLLLTTREVATEVAANVLGLDSDDPEAIENSEDAVKELMNVVLGRLLTEIAGVEAVFDLSSPLAFGGGTIEDWSKFSETSGTLAFDVEGSPVLLLFGDGSALPTWEGRAA